MDIIDNLKAFIFDRGYSQRDNHILQYYTPEQCSGVFCI